MTTCAGSPTGTGTRRRVVTTEAGVRYHRPRCAHAEGAALEQRSSSLTLAQAGARGLTPCGSCRPPPLLRVIHGGRRRVDR